MNNKFLGELTKQEREYQMKYGNIPKTKEERVAYIMQNYKVDMDKYNRLVEHNKSIQWNILDLQFELIPKPTPRPRLNPKTNTFYVSGAQENKKIIKRLLTDFNIIFTGTRFCITTYQPIPISSAKGYEILAAEEGIIRPLADPDWDNLGKTYSDMLQHYLLLNDNIIIHGEVDKYYSIRPRIDIHIEYQDNFDSNFNKKRIINSKAFKTMVDPVLLLPLEEREKFNG